MLKEKSPYTINSILIGFDNVMLETSEVTMFDDADRERISRQIQESQENLAK